MTTYVRGAVIAAAVASMFAAKGAFAQGYGAKNEKAEAKVKCEGVNECKG